MGTVPAAKALNCPNCGAALTIRALEHTLSVVCVQCLSILDAKDPNFQVLQQFEARQRYVALIPLGTRGKWRGDMYEVIGFQVRGVDSEEASYAWHEYLLFNPYKGFRYLTEYNGHWNDVKTLRAAPQLVLGASKAAVKALGQTYLHFQTASAQTIYVMGEFPWQVKVGELVAVSDYIAPPQILSSETTEAETVWSLGEYVEGARIWEAFKLAGSAPPAVGIFANQPSPYQAQSIKQVWIYCVALLLLLINLALFFSTFARQEEVFRRRYSFSPRAPGDPSFVTPVFELQGRPSAAEVSIRTDLSSDWAYFNFAMINEATGQAFDFGREVSNYPGEGSPNDSVRIPTVPAGRYYLRVEPEMSRTSIRPMSYELQVRRDVPAATFYWLAGLLIVAPPAFLTFRASSFEKARWQESGPADVHSGDGEDDS